MAIVILVTAKDFEKARKISLKLTECKLIACANIVKGVRSVFRWEGKVDEAGEVLMIMKTKQEHFSEIVKIVKSLHSYDTPEIIALPIIEGSEDYLNWIEASVL